jgi:site-specific DNA-cytosine methylase
MKILELFSGTESFSKVARERGHEVFTIDNNPIFKPDLCKNIINVNLNELPFKPDIIWASPPCQKFSVSTIGKNWNIDNTPKTKDAQRALDLVNNAISIIQILNPKYFFIENPRGKLRKLINFGEIKTVTYCQYGDTRMKPTDIWTNNKNWKPKPMCKNGDSCHVSAPRGSRTGTQGLKNSIERGIIPKELCLEIIKSCEE